MALQTVNALYDASMNEIVFSGACRQAPCFDVAVDNAASSGAIGVEPGDTMYLAPADRATIR